MMGMGMRMGMRDKNDIYTFTALTPMMGIERRKKERYMIDVFGWLLLALYVV